MESDDKIAEAGIGKLRKTTETPERTGNEDANRKVVTEIPERKPTKTPEQKGTKPLPTALTKTAGETKHMLESVASRGTGAINETLDENNKTESEISEEEEDSYNFDEVASLESSIDELELSDNAEDG